MVVVVIPAQRVLLRLQNAGRDHRCRLLDAADVVAELVAAARDPEIERADVLKEAVEELAVVRVAGHCSNVAVGRGWRRGVDGLAENVRGGGRRREILDGDGPQATSVAVGAPLLLEQLTA